MTDKKIEPSNLPNNAKVFCPIKNLYHPVKKCDGCERLGGLETNIPLEKIDIKPNANYMSEHYSLYCWTLVKRQIIEVE